MNSIPKIEPAPLKSCYQRTSKPSFAVSFALSDGDHLIAPYAYFEHGKRKRSGELVFFYNFGEIHVTGQKLEVIYDAAHVHELKSVCCHDRADIDPAAPWVEKIVLKEKDLYEED